MFTSTFDLKNFSNEVEGISYGDIQHNNYCVCTCCSFSGNVKDNSNLSSSSRTNANFQTMANYLTTGFWPDFGQSTREWNLGSYSGYNPTGGTITYSLGRNERDSNGLTTGVSRLYRESFKLFEETLGINFQEISYYSSSADIDVIDNGGSWSAYAGSGNTYGKISSAYINMGESWTNYFGTSLGTYSLQTVHHEIGHAIGLGHQGDYNGSASYWNDSKFVNDSWQASMMSYFSQSENYNVNATRVYLMTPSAVDWIALDDIYSDYSGYGVSNAFNGDTIFGFNTNISSSTSEIWSSFSSKIRTNAYCIVDGSGNDTLDLSEMTSNDKVDLRPTDKNSTTLYTSNIAGNIGNLHIAADTYIENCITGSGNDTLIGNNKNNTLSGRAGNDTIDGGAGNDTLDGGVGTDTAIYNGNFSDYRFTLNTSSGAIQIIDGISSRDGTDQVSKFESFKFNAQTYSLRNILNKTSFNSLSYLASNSDLINLFGQDTAAAFNHYVNFGQSQGRAPDSFDEWSYMASHADLINAFGDDNAAGTKHYVRYGYREGRSLDSFDEWSYMASHADLINAFGDDNAAGTKHYVRHGYREGRSKDSFDEWSYMASHADLINAFGYDNAAGTSHYVSYGYREGRSKDSFDEWSYMASHADLINAFGDDNAAGTKHYVRHGYREGRSKDSFDEWSTWPVMLI